MTDAVPGPTASDDGQSTAEQAALAAEAAVRGAAPPHAPTASADDRPELVVGAAFAGGLVLALVLKRLAR